MILRLHRYLLLLLFLGCAEKAFNFEKELSEENLKKVNIEVLGIDLMVPEGSTVFNYEVGTSINLNPKGRLVRQFRITNVSPEIENIKFEKSYLFENDVKLEYGITTNNGGSGGMEYVLNGILRLKSQAFYINSSCQGAFNTAESTFCFKYLSTIVMHKPR